MVRTTPTIVVKLPTTEMDASTEYGLKRWIMLVWVNVFHFLVELHTWCPNRRRGVPLLGFQLHSTRFILQVKLQAVSTWGSVVCNVINVVVVAVFLPFSLTYNVGIGIVNFPASCDALILRET